MESTAPAYLLEHLSQKDPDLEIVPVDGVFLDLRVVKSEEKIARIDKASFITGSDLLVDCGCVTK